MFKFCENCNCTTYTCTACYHIGHCEHWAHADTCGKHHAFTRLITEVFLGLTSHFITKTRSIYSNIGSAVYWTVTNQAGREQCDIAIDLTLCAQCCHCGKCVGHNCTWLGHKSKLIAVRHTVNNKNTRRMCVGIL